MGYNLTRTKAMPCLVANAENIRDGESDWKICSPNAGGETAGTGVAREGAALER
jgi:hypothetical protein